MTEVSAFARTDPAAAFGRSVQAIIAKGLDACASDPRWKTFVAQQARQARSPAVEATILQQAEVFGVTTEGLTRAQLRALVWEAAELPMQERANELQEILARVNTWARAFVHIRETINPELIMASVEQAVGLAQEAAAVRFRPVSAQDLWEASLRAKLVKDSGLAACRWR
ncbi:hypothetical protein HYH03_009039 [Edaphochlamys debaryana]|uniref:Uncharacterized protein n=1 Tax=Edaphochlamys debaryana TaxID=47281 RepID=A0A835Y0X6_9CHLO|nr:hypothetical protein HYH03_009039 [Edaphochlamys debaryana]|eukprot:KAG2492623.1 hypothetical protein HYH03_009039 [Edaphochlamys debaryana]